MEHKQRQQDRDSAHQWREREGENLRNEHERYAREHAAGYLLTQRADSSGWSRFDSLDHGRQMFGIPHEEQSLSALGGQPVHRRARMRPDGMEHVGHPMNDDQPGYGAHGRFSPGGRDREQPLFMRDRREPRGPKGYVRSDERIYDELWQRLIRLGELQLDDVVLQVSQGVVTVTGTVSDRFTKYVIEECCETTFGVRETLNQLRVARAP